MMKKVLFGMMGAIALSFTACTSEEELAEVNPKYNAETNEVTTDFVFNVATNNMSTRSSATTVQSNGDNFRGMNDAILLAYVGAANDVVFGDAASEAAAKRYDFPTLLASGAVDNSGSKSNRILELGLPVGTNAMLFYGHAPQGTLSNNENGKIDYSTEGNVPAEYTFSLVKRIDGYKQRCHNTGNYLCYIMTAATLAEGTSTMANIVSQFPTETEATLAAKFPNWTDHTAPIKVTWKELGTQYAANQDSDESNDRTLTPLEEILGHIYYSFTSENPDEYRAGSGSAVFYMMSDIYTTLDAMSSTTPTSPQELLAKAIAGDLMNRISLFFSHDGTLTGYSNVSSAIDQKVALKVAGIETADAYNAAFLNGADAVVTSDLADFPITTFNLPRGAAIIKYDTQAGKFVYDLSKRVTNADLEMDTEKYMFPAELMYRCNSWIRTANTEKKNADYPNGVGNWDTDGNWTGWVEGKSHVTSSTRAAALGQNINYGVALLESTLGVKTGVTQYEDNTKKFYPNEDAQVVAVGDLDITLTGILVGGQSDGVDWEFLPLESDLSNVIYDNAINGGQGIAAPTAAGAKAAPNYTVVLDNYVAGNKQTDEVRVALEFRNNGDDFWGRDNMVRKDGTFYLIGKLPLGTNQISEWDTYYQVPPLNADGTSKQITRIFTQDYVTKATFNLTANSLKDAYVTVPDLRSAQISFGLSVDIEWRPGIEFEIDLSGDNHTAVTPGD